MSTDASKPVHIVPFISDYGFKVTFAVGNSLFSRKAIELLADLGSPIERLELLRNEFVGITTEARSGIYDVFCRDERSRLFIIEMQATDYSFFKERLLFYIFHLYNSMVKKGDDGFANLKPIHCICIVENRVMKKGDYYQKFSIQSDAGHIFYEPIEIHLIELGKFPIKRNEYHKVKTEKEELVYTMKYGHQIDLRKAIQVPPFWQKEWIEEAINKLDQRSMTQEEITLMEMGIVKINMIAYGQRQQLEAAKKEAVALGEALGKARGEALGEARGEARGERLAKEKAIIKALQRGKLTIKEIAEDFEIAESKVIKIKKALETPKLPKKTK